MPDTIRSGSGDDRTHAGKPRGPYTGVQIFVMLATVLVLALAVRQANSLLNIDDPPATASQPVLSLVLDPFQRLSWAKNSEYQVRESFQHCRNPVEVTVDALVNDTQNPFITPPFQGATTAPSGYVHGQLTHPGVDAGNFRLLENPGGYYPASWVVPRGEFIQHDPRGKFIRDDRGALIFGAPLHSWYPSVLPTSGMAPVQTLQRAVLVELRFQANWVLPRSSATCFVRIPKLLDPLVDPTSMADLTSYWAPAAGPGQVNVISTTGDTADWQDSIPAPTDPRVPQWQCSMVRSVTDPFGGANCGGVAVFSVPGGNTRAQLWLLIDGTVIGLAAALLIDTLKDYRRKEHEVAELPDEFWQRPGC